MDAITAPQGVTIAREFTAHAVLLLVSHLNENRDAVVAGNMSAAILPFGVNALVQPFREESV